MSDNLIMTERLMKAATCLNEAEMLVKAEGQWENLERLSGWSPAHFASRLEIEKGELERGNARLREESQHRHKWAVAQQLKAGKLAEENDRLMEAMTKARLSLEDERGLGGMRCFAERALRVLSFALSSNPEQEEGK